jgi:hypothetical protein
MPINHRVLSCGRDACLLRLRHGHWNVPFSKLWTYKRLVLSKHRLRITFDVVVICYSIPESRRKSAAEDRRRPLAACWDPHPRTAFEEQCLHSLRPYCQSGLKGGCIRHQPEQFRIVGKIE